MRGKWRPDADGPRLARHGVARNFVVALLLIAAGVALAWSAINPAQALAITIAVLVVSCPCALSLATPAALGAAGDSLHRQGVLVTRSDAIEGLAKATDIVFDKTGTLTDGQLELRDVQCFGDTAPDTAIARSPGSMS